MFVNIKWKQPNRWNYVNLKRDTLNDFVPVLAMHSITDLPNGIKLKEFPGYDR